jgi:glycosyltransferase involved in cell wall biosynthesis
MIAAPALHFLIPGDLAAGTGGYVYDRRVIGGLRALGWQVMVHQLDASFPYPTAGALQGAQEVLESLPDQATVLVDGLALGAMPEQLRMQARRLRLWALIHLPLAAEVGLPPELAERLRASERQALQAVGHVIVTSSVTLRMLGAEGIPPQRLTVIEPGVDEVPFAPRRTQESLRLLCVGTLSTGKAQELLVDALAPLRQWPWQLTCVGSLERDRAAVQRLRAKLSQLGMEARIELAGEIEQERLTPYYLNADLFVLPTLFETYGMAVAEALAHGLPVVSTRTGAIPQMLGSQAGLLVQPGDRQGLQDALLQLFEDRCLLERLAAGARVARERLPRWSQSCAHLSALLQGPCCAPLAIPVEQRREKC